MAKVTSGSGFIALKLNRRGRLIAGSLALCSALFWTFNPFGSSSPYSSHYVGSDSPAKKYLSDVAGPPFTYGAQQNLTVFDHPTVKFRDNLWPDKKYIMTFATAGWTNDLLVILNMIYLGILTDRIPIIPPFSNNIRLNSSTPTYFGDMFDLPRLRKSLGINILEWRDVQVLDWKEPEPFGCWSTWWAGAHHDKPDDLDQPRELGLDVSYTKAPMSTLFNPNELGIKLLDLMALAYPEARAEALKENSPAPSFQLHKTIEPDQQLFCADWIFYLGATRSRDLFDTPHGLVWRFVGKHVHYTPYLEEEARKYLREAFDIPEGENIPPYIALHIRRGDFKNWCDSDDVCLASPTQYQDRIREIQNELLQTKGVEVKHVIATSDDSDDFWMEVESLGLMRDSSDAKIKGWKRIDHQKMRTVERYGSWYPPVFDSLFHSQSIGFVGTGLSTFSEVGRLRVRDWNGGTSRTVRWGKDA